MKKEKTPPLKHCHTCDAWWVEGCLTDQRAWWCEECRREEDPKLLGWSFIRTKRVSRRFIDN